MGPVHQIPSYNHLIFAGVIVPEVFFATRVTGNDLATQGNLDLIGLGRGLAQGQPVFGAELAVVVVDEAILALTNYQQANPLNAFYYQRPSYLESVYGRASIILVDPLALAYYRYEWVVQDMGDYGERIFFLAGVGRETRQAAVQGFAQMFDPGDVVQSAYQSEGMLPAPLRSAGM